MTSAVNIQGDEHVLITRDEYERLRSRVDFLDALEAGGVDNWEGYYYARKEFYSEEDDD